ncbi:MAG: RNA polymerase sigma factor [Phycisphaerales bacterium]
MNDSLKVNADDVGKLVRAGQAGERGAFDELVRLYQRPAMQIAVRILGNASDAAEVVQDGFIKAYVSINKLKQPKRFEAWFFRIIINTAISWRRAAKRRTEQIKIVDEKENEKALTPVENQTREELKDAIQRAMLKLSKKEVKAIALFGIEDLSQNEVAEIMNCSVETVRWYVYRARKKLKVLLKEYLE